MSCYSRAACAGRQQAAIAKPRAVCGGTHGCFVILELPVVEGNKLSLLNNIAEDTWMFCDSRAACCGGQQAVVVYPRVFIVEGHVRVVRNL